MELTNKMFINRYKENNHILSSFVLNPPYETDIFTTSPKLEKIFNFPFGLQLEATALFNLINKGLISLVTFMIGSCILFFSIYIPVQKQNQNLLHSSKKLINNQYSLLIKQQESSNYKKLFEVANSYSFAEPEEIIHVKASNTNLAKRNNKTSLNKYPLIHYAGF